ncbi:MAG TPA: transcription termination/antitermination NusG family protein [Xanthobacteraceae bacterium]|nr:transcription termination/antitermination NusG family protein [Xanthobacteraceae bacterium]
MTAVDAASWYAVQTLAGHESTAALHLRRLRLWVFLPMSPVVRRPGDSERRWRPRFTGYVFVQLDLDQPGWQRVNKAVGVRHLLPVYLDRPLPLPHGFVERLMSQPDDDSVLIEFGEHDLVRIIIGSLDLLAEVERQDGERIRARLDNGAVIETRTASVERA